MKRFLVSITILLCAMLLVPCLASAASSATDEINLVIEGKKVEADVPPVIKDGRTLVPVRVIAEQMGAKVDWNQASQTATILHQQKEIKLQLNNKRASIDSKGVSLDTPPQIFQNRMLLPLRFVGEALGSTVGWDKESRTVVANRPVRVHINGQDLTGSLKTYKLDGTLFLPIQPILQKVGVNVSPLSISPVKTIDSVTVAPISVLESLLGGVDWDAEHDQVVVEHVQLFEGYTVVNDRQIIVKTSKPVTPQHFTMEGPHRLVIDLPNTKLADQIEEIKEPSQPEAEAAKQEDTTATEDQPSDIEDQQTDSAKEADSATENSADSHAVTTTGLPFIQNIRYSQYSNSPYTVRIVVELSQKSKYTVSTNGNEIRFDLTPVPRKTGFMIVVDAGHGGKDPGAKGVSGNIEKDFNLSVATKLVEILSKYPEFQVVATRSQDVFIPLQDRTKIANDLDADLFISIHANSFKPDTRGTETYYYHDFSKAFAEVVHRHLIAATKFPNRGVQTAPFVVIKQTKMPAVLTETGFLTNKIENSQMVTPEFQQKIAQALADAIREYYQSYH